MAKTKTNRRFTSTAKKTTRKASAKAAGAKRTPKRAPIESAAQSTPSGEAIIKMLQRRGVTETTTGTRRPPNNPEVPALVIKALNQDLGNIKEALDEYAQHLRAVETLYASLSPFFKSMGERHKGEEAQPTKKEELREFKGLQRGTHDGVLFIENEKPKLTGGKHKFLDETFKDTEQFKESADGEIKE